ncbi:MAG TPA: circularly permuted type 2 ATP-grasp protein, partial [bacterium]|nr:circularly permuted type 2 ATP-grasp protein [bacterium]
MKLDRYQTQGFYDEMFLPDGAPREACRPLLDRMTQLGDGEVERRQQAAERALLHMGITFNVYGESEGTERIFPLDIVPRIVTAQEWAKLESGLMQRVYALNQFIHDIYHKQKIIQDKVVPEELVKSATSFRPQCMGLNPPRDIWCHITGTDLVRHSDGQYYVLEDNLRCPSGVSYVLGNRQVMKQTFPQVFGACRVVPVDDYPSRLLSMLQCMARGAADRPVVAVLTPGPYNSAYFEHSYLAQRMGVQLVEGRDLAVRDGVLCMRTTRGFERVDVLYRRIDDDFLDPRAFRSDSYLGVPGLMEVYAAGNVGLANAPGT